MRPIFLAVQDLTASLGGPRAVARKLGVSEGHVYKYGQDPDQSGKDIPLRHLLDLLAESIIAPVTAGAVAREIVDNFANRAGLSLRTDNAATEVRYVLDLLERRAAMPARMQTCPQCHKPLRLESMINDVPIYRCTEKHAVGPAAGRPRED
jgi:hypothetical protein